MYDFRRAAMPALILIALAGCAGQNSRHAGKDVVGTLQPIDVTLGVKQPELYADFEPSTAGQAAAAGCGAVPGIGLLLAMACGGAAGAMDATVNSARAKAADEVIRPLKDELVDVAFDKMLSESLEKELRAVPGMQMSTFAVTKTVENKAYEERFLASTATGVMFINIDYHISRDFSALQASASALLYPRAPSAQKFPATSADRVVTN